MSRKNNPAAPPCARLLKIEIPHTAWVNLTAVTRRLLRVPIAWRKRKSGDRPLRLRWKIRGQGGYQATVVDGSAVATEVLAILSAVGVRPKKELGQHAIRRIPMGAILTDPEGKGDRVHVETAGIPMLMRTRRGQWKRYDVLGALWPQDAQEVLGEWVALVDGCIAPAAEERNRYVLEEGTPTYATRGGKVRKTVEWKALAAHATLDKAREALDARVAEVVKLALASPPVWRVIDTGSCVTRSRVRLTGPNNAKILRADYDPACREKVEMAA